MKNSIQKIHEYASAISKKKWLRLSYKVRPDDFLNYPNILCVFQTFNKSHLLRLVLTPFLKAKFKNIILFADGCIDVSSKKASNLLVGKRHAVISVNDLHEIHNYRFAITSEWGRQAEFALLMQDDDIYPDSFEWLDYGLEMMRRDRRLVVLGFNGGVNIQRISLASETFATDKFEINQGSYRFGSNLEGEFVRRPGLMSNRLDFNYGQIAIRAPQLIRIAEFLDNTSFDSGFEPYQDDDANFCLELWSKGWKVGFVHGLNAFRGVGMSGMKLGMELRNGIRPAHMKRNHNYLFERYGNFINSGKLHSIVAEANASIAKKFLYL